ncbi:MAG TPA: UPF0149 family protein [Wenzhouxiangella sp.]|nr:UPF0149 family protein [Wenzhouxiangella sp.]
MSSTNETRLAWLLALAADSAPQSVSETHGVITGLLCGKPAQDENELATHLAALQMGDWTSDRIVDEIGPALRQLRSELDSPTMSFQPLLPTDERALEERTLCLAHWCSGFLAGFGAAEPTIRSDEAREALHMIEQIARAGTDSDADQEAEETAYAELVEFVRMAILLLREECRGSAITH